MAVSATLAVREAALPERDSPSNTSVANPSGHAGGFRNSATARRPHFERQAGARGARSRPGRELVLEVRSSTRQSATRPCHRRSTAGSAAASVRSASPRDRDHRAHAGSLDRHPTMTSSPASAVVLIARSPSMTVSLCGTAALVNPSPAKLSPAWSIGRFKCDPWQPAIGKTCVGRGARHRPRTRFQDQARIVERCRGARQWQQAVRRFGIGIAARRRQSQSFEVWDRSPRSSLVHRVPGSTPAGRSISRYRDLSQLEADSAWRSPT